LVEFKGIRGHNGCEENELADAIAKQVAVQIKSITPKRRCGNDLKIKFYSICLKTADLDQVERKIDGIKSVLQLM
jgi:hypothetical protein